MKFTIDRGTLGRLIFVIMTFLFIALHLLEGGLFAIPGIVWTIGLSFVLIWFGDELGAFTGFVHLWKVNPTPGILIKIAGWVVLSLEFLRDIYQLFR